MFGCIVNGIADHIFGVMLERHHEIRKHTVYFSTAGLIASVPGDAEQLTFAIIMADHPFAVIQEGENAFLAHGTKIFIAVR